MLGSIGKQSRESVESVLEKKKKKATEGRICGNGRSERVRVLRVVSRKGQIERGSASHWRNLGDWHEVDEVIIIVVILWFLCSTQTELK